MISNLDTVGTNMKNRDYKIDFFKGIAMLMIIFVHSTQKFLGINDILASISEFGQMGTQIFLVLAAHNAVFSFERRNKNVKQWWKSRIKSIIPAWWLSIILYVLINFTIVDILKIKNVYRSSTNIKGIIINAMGLNGLVPKYNNNVVPGGWYIGTLVILFVFFSKLYQILKNRTKREKYLFLVSICFVDICIFLCVGNVVGYDFVRNNSFVYFLFINQLPVFCIGILYAIEGKTINKTKGKFYLVIGIVSLIISIVMFYSEIWWIYCIVPTLFAIAYICLYIGIGEVIKFEQSRIKRAICWIGKKSYFIYLTHVLWVFYLPGVLYYICMKFNVRYLPTVYWCILIIPMVLLSCLSAKIFEKITGFVKKKLNF